MTSTSTSTATTLSARTGRTRQIRRLAGAGVGLIALTAGLGACGTGGSDATSDAGRLATFTTAADDPTAAAAVDPAEVTPYSGGNDTTAGISGPAPVIDSFVTPEDIDCHNGDFQEFTASWTTTDATKVTISIDGPGIYAEYPVDGETSLPFTCSSSHTFLLTAHGSNGQKATRTITLQPRNVQSETNSEDEEDGGLRRVPAGSTAKMQGGSTGTGATNEQCEAVAASLDGLYDQMVATTNGNQALAIAEVAGAIQSGAEAAGCFFVGEGQ